MASSPKNKFIENTHPQIASQLHPTKNDSTSTKNITAQSRKSFWWICDVNPSHSYQASFQVRCKQFNKGMHNPCPECNSLNTNYPDLAKQWDSEKNLPNKPETISCGSNFVATWICTDNQSHMWQQSVKSRVYALKKNVTRGSECPICLNIKASVDTCLSKTHPLLAAEWDYDENTKIGLSINQVTYVSRAKAFWICSKNHNHQWAAVIRDRAGVKTKKG